MRDIIAAISRGFLIVLALVLTLAAGEIAFRPSPEAMRIATWLSVAGAGAILILQQLYYGGRARVQRYRNAAIEAGEEVAGLRRQVQAIERDRKLLRQQVENLSAHRELSRAASQHTSLGDFLDEIAGVVHDLAGARDLTMFLTDESATGPVPRAYYSLSRATELCLSITDSGGVTLMQEMEEDEDDSLAIDAELLSSDKLNVTPMGGQVVVSGRLNYRKAEVGLARLTLNHIDPNSLPSIETIDMLMQAELGRVRLNALNVLAAMEHRQPVHYDTARHHIDLASPLSTDGELIGVVKVRFDCREEGEEQRRSISERARLLSESARHIARAVRSEKIYEQTITDQLTGLYNKRYMMSQLEGYFNVASRHKTHLSMILVDIDHFKSVNDNHGHLTGDIILKNVSAILMDGVRNCDSACRYGGEELAVILPEGSLEGSVGLAERLRQKLEAAEHVSDKGEKLTVTASFGVAQYSPDMRRVEDLIARADSALYESKSGGRNRVTAWQAPPEADLHQESAKISRRMPARSK